MDNNKQRYQGWNYSSRNSSNSCDLISKKHHYSHALASSVDAVKREAQIRRRLQNNEKEREENSLGQKQETAQSKPLNMSKVWDHYNPKHVVY